MRLVVPRTRPAHPLILMSMGAGCAIAKYVGSWRLKDNLGFEICVELFMMAASAWALYYHCPAMGTTEGSYDRGDRSSIGSTPDSCYDCNDGSHGCAGAASWAFVSFFYPTLAWLSYFGTAMGLPGCDGRHVVLFLVVYVAAAVCTAFVYP